MQLKTSVKPGNLNCEAIMLPKAPPCYTDCMFRYPVPLLWFHLPFLHKSSLLINASLPKRHAFFRPFPLVMWDCANIMFPGASAETSNTNAATFMQNRADEREKHIQGFFFPLPFFSPKHIILLYQDSFVFTFGSLFTSGFFLFPMNVISAPLVKDKLVDLISSFGIHREKHYILVISPTLLSFPRPTHGQFESKSV